MVMMDWISSRTLTSFICHSHSILSVLRLLDHANTCCYCAKTWMRIAVPAVESVVSDPFSDKSETPLLHTFELEQNPSPIGIIRWISWREGSHSSRHESTLFQTPQITPVFSILHCGDPGSVGNTILRQSEKIVHVVCFKSYKSSASLRSAYHVELTSTGWTLTRTFDTSNPTFATHTLL
jgi:hypothetical protein